VKLGSWRVHDVHEILIEVLENKWELGSFQKIEKILVDPEIEKYLEHFIEEKIDKEVLLVVEKLKVLDLEYIEK